MPPARKLAPGLALALAACGGGGGGADPGDVRTVLVDFSLPYDSPHAAVTEYATGRVRIRRDQEDSPYLPALVIHELEHAVGLTGHLPQDSDCYRRPDVFMHDGGEPCIAELEQMRDVTGTWAVRVSVAEPVLGPLVASATLWWEARVGRDDLFDFEYLPE
jgi:hypothetical protein